MSLSASTPSPISATCVRCKTPSHQTYTLRQEPHCHTCYQTFIRTKFVKRLESYNLIRRTGPRSTSTPEQLPTFLLPLSFGIASGSLLDLISWHLEGQKTHRTGVRYRVVVVNVDEGVLHGCDGGNKREEGVWEEWKQRYGRVVEKWVKVGLEDVYDYSPEEKGEDGDKGKSKGERLRDLMTALPSPTSRMDLVELLRRRLVVGIAKARECVGVLWGDTTTKLAQRTLAQTAKGRGFAVPMVVGDEAGAAYGMKMLYPLREVFTKELVLYTRDIASPPLISLCISYSSEPKHSAAKATSGRNITVDELMTQYFEQMEEQYPHIVSNVIRTAGRLKVQDPGAKKCGICGLPGDGGRSGLTLGEVDEEGEEAVGKVSDLCYGCLRSTHGASGSIAWPL